MFTEMQDFIAEQMKAFSDRAPGFNGEPAAIVRQGLDYSVAGLRSFERPVSVAAQSGVQLAAVSHKVARDLIELQSEMLTAALGEVAESFERVAAAKDPASLVGAQLDAARASAERLVGNANRAAEIFTAAGNGVQKVVVDAYEAFAPSAKPTPSASGQRRAGRKAAA